MKKTAILILLVSAIMFTAYSSATVMALAPAHPVAAPCHGGGGHGGGAHSAPPRAVQKIPAKALAKAPAKKVAKAPAKEAKKK